MQVFNFSLDKSDNNAIDSVCTKSNGFEVGMISRAQVQDICCKGSDDKEKTKRGSSWSGIRRRGADIVLTLLVNQCMLWLTNC
jgi:hypothetical protein